MFELVELTAMVGSRNESTHAMKTSDEQDPRKERERREKKSSQRRQQ